MSRKSAIRAVCALLLVAGPAVTACSSSYDDYSTDSGGDSNTFPESDADSNYTGNNGSEAESYCEQINSPDMEACQSGFNNLSDALDGG